MENKIFIKKETMKGIADAIRAKDGTTEEIAVTDMAERIEALGGGGIPSESIYTVTLRSLNVFGRSKVELYFPFILTLQNLVNLGTANTSAERVNTTVEELTITCDNQITSVSNALANYRTIPDRTLRKITLNCDLSKAAGFSGFLANHYAIEEILGTPIDMSSATSVSNFCTNCLALREIRFQGIIPQSLDFAYSPLSKQSIISASKCLSPTATGKTLTLSQTAVNTAFETSPGAADGSTSTEWAELIVTKPNWTISLV